MTVTTEFDTKQVVERFEERRGRAQLMLNSQIIKDSNFYVPNDTGALESSALPATNEPEVVWSMPYAAAQYYGLPNKSKDKNPNACMRWFEVAKAQHVKDWEKLVQSVFS